MHPLFSSRAPAQGVNTLATPWVRRGVTLLRFLLPWILIGLFSAAYVRLGFLNHFHFRTGLDLGIYNQALHHLSYFRLPYSSLKEQVLWGDHAHFILVLLAPLYRVFPYARTLIVVQALAVTTAGWALYRVAQETMQSRLFALAVLFSYLSFIGIQYALDFDFHANVLTAVALAWAIYGFHLRKPWVYWVAVLLGLITREDAAPIFFMVGAYACGRRQWRTGFATMAISLTYFLTVGYLIMPLWTPGNIPLAYLDAEDKNVFHLAFEIVKHPITTLQNLFDPAVKARTIRTLFQSFGLLPLLSPFTYLASAPIFTSRFLSPSSYRWIIENHSNAQMLPILTYGAILGSAALTKVLTRLGSVSWAVRLAAPRGVVTAVLSLLLIASTTHTGFRDRDVPLRKLWNPEYTQEEFLPRTGRAAFRLVKTLIPPEGGVSASSGLVPHLSSRKYIYNFPTVNEKTDWIVLSPEFNTWPLRRGETEKAITQLKSDPTYELVWQEYGIWLFKRQRVPAVIAPNPEATP